MSLIFSIIFFNKLKKCLYISNILQNNVIMYIICMIGIISLYVYILYAVILTSCLHNYNIFIIKYTK